MKKIILLIPVFLFHDGFAQNENDALRYSQITINGTARYNSMCGAFGALGADLSTLSSNPAGIAVYRRSEFVLSPAITNRSANSSYNGTTLTNNKYNFNLANIGVVGTYNINNNEDENGWISWNIGLAYNRLSDFNNRINTQGANTPGSSLSDVYVYNAKGIYYKNLDPFVEGMAFNTYVIDSSNGNNYFSNVPASVTQRKSIESSGNMNEIALSMGGNYRNKLFIGATIGIQNISYFENSIYSESATSTTSAFRSFTLHQQVSTTGIGINAKLGLIYRLRDWLRIGAAFHTPTASSMQDNYVYSMNSVFSSASYSDVSPTGYFSYSMVTPPRVIGSAAVIIKKRAVIDVDYEFVDYTYSRFSASTADFSDVNEKIRNKYTATSNVRVGAEWMVSGPMAVRAGVAWYGSPYKSTEGVNAGRFNYSAGIGYKGRNIFVDVAYVITQYQENYQLYDASIAPVNPVKNNFTSGNFVLSLGVKY